MKINKNSKIKNILMLIIFILISSIFAFNTNSLSNSNHNDNINSEIINLKNSAPSVSIVSPTAGTYGPPSIFINASITDVLEAKAMINATTDFNISLTNSSGYWSATWNNVSLYSSGDYNITIWAINGTGIINQTESVIISLDIDSPSVNITEPTNGSDQYNNADIEINATITDLGSGVSSAKAMINATTTFNITMQYITGEWTCTWSNTSFYAAGDYNITIWAIDGEGNVNQTEFHIIILNDIINPSVSITDPTDLSSWNNKEDIDINATITDQGSTVVSTKAMINATTQFNLTMQFIVGEWTCTWGNTSVYAEGDYNITIWAIDGEGNINQSEFHVITLNDIINPSVTITNPSDLSSWNNTKDIDINATITDLEDISSAKAMINATTPFNITMLYSPTNWTCTWSNTSLYEAGDYNITIWTIDNEGNINQTEYVIITLNDIINPSVSIGTPIDESSHDNDASFDINATITDLEGISSAKAMINGTTPFNITMLYSPTNWTCTWSNTSLYEAGDYKITIWTIDNEGNINQIEYVIITLNDVINPSVSIGTPIDGSSHDNDASFDINATITDLEGISSAKAMINATTPFNITMLYSPTNWTCTWSNTSLYAAGDYKITIWAIDGMGNINKSEYVIITRQDLIKPIITFDSLVNGSYVTNVFNITVNIDDTNDPTFGDVIATISNGSITPFNLTLFRIGGTSLWTVEWSNITSEYAFGDYFINVTAFDSSVNRNFNTTGLLNISFVDDDTPPTYTDPELDNMAITDTSYTINIEIIDVLSPPGDGDVILEVIKNPHLFNVSMQNTNGNTWSFTWTNVSSYDNGDYTFRIWYRDSSQNGTWQSLDIPFSISIGAGPGGFDLLGFLLSPMGLAIIGSIAVAVIAATVLIKRKDGHKASDMEKVRIGRLMGESLCEKCEFYDVEATFCNKLLIVKRYDLNAPCKDFKLIKPEIEGKVENLEEQVVEIEIIEGSPCNKCQYMNMKTGLCDKYMRYKQLKPGTFCKGYRKPKEEKVKIKEKKKHIIKILGPQLCTTCQHQDLESGFCNKYLTYKKLKPTESCKSYKKSRVENEEALERAKEETITKKDWVTSDKLLGPRLCAACQFFDGESSFCNKLLSFKKLRPTESCKSYKKKQ